ncbi:MAG: radical SAM protein [Candidatus Coatesbacteria bacterium]|nr:radical SAM protein [Candidatus Coatesbacteria bacterium]
MTHIRHSEQRLSCVERALDKLTENLRSCKLCPRSCGVDRAAGQLGFCRAGPLAKVFRFAPHPGEEPPISGKGGSGTVFFSHCTMMCVYCQNHRFSQHDEGRQMTAQELFQAFLSLQEAGCHNLNLVTPSHFLLQILDAMRLALAAGFDLPIVYNTSSYETPEVVAALDGVVDVYLADARYADAKLAAEYSKTPDYVARSREALKAMWRQVGPLVLDERDIAQKGLIIRHLVLPGRLEDTRRALEWIAAEISTDVAVSLMGQYRPAHEAVRNRTLNRRLSPAEYDEALKVAQSFDFETLFIQPPDSGFPDDLFGERMPGDA